MIAFWLFFLLPCTYSYVLGVPLSGSRRPGCL
jgi:hypothetical protein